MIVGFIDEHREGLGVESICAALQIAPSTYYAAKRREAAPSARARRDAKMREVLMVLWVANKRVTAPASSGKLPAALATTSAAIKSPG